MRFGEACALRWRDRIDGDPMRSLHVHSSYSTRRKAEGETKTGGVRKMPEHPTLTRILNEWRLSGWAGFWGHAPPMMT